MILCLLDKIPDIDKSVKIFEIYSFGIIDTRISACYYTIKFNDKIRKIKTDKEIEIGKWIRFYGRIVDDIIKCEFTEILDGIDMNLVIKCIDKCTNISS